MDIFENVELLLIVLIVVIMASVSLVLSIRAYVKYSNIEKKYDMFMSGRDAESLEEFFLSLQNDVDFLMNDTKRLKEGLKETKRLSKISYQKFGIYRYDAFSEKTGKRSFAICLLDYTNTGIVMTFQNTGNGTVVFIKEIDAGSTSVKLGPEEEKALNIAMEQIEKDAI